MGDPDVRTSWWVVPGSALLAATAAAVGVVLYQQPGGAPLRWVVGAALVMGLLGLVLVPAAGRTEFTPGYVVAASLPFLTEPGFDAASTGATVAAALAATWLFRMIRRDDPRAILLSFLKRSLAYSAYLSGYVIAFSALENIDWRLSDWDAAVAFVVAATAAFVLEVISSAVLRFEPGGRASVYFAFETARDLPIYLSLVATGALFGLAFGSISWGALVLAALPYAFAHSAFRRFEQTKRAYRQTIEALAQIPEVGGHTDPGHSRRTAQLSVAIATELGLRPSEVEFTEYAAFLHDIGRVSLNEPSVLRMGFTENDVARWGAEIVGETAYLSGVAEVVRRQYEPFRSPGDGGDPDLPVAAKIVKIASAYDESVVELGFSPLEAMDRLHRGAAYDYDPQIVAVLRTVLDRRGVFHPVTARA